MGGMLSDPVQIYPTLFGPNSSFGGQDGVQWLITYPYALPMLANAFFLAACAIFVYTSFEEVRNLSFLKLETNQANMTRHSMRAKENQDWALLPCVFSLAVSKPSSHLPPRCTLGFPSVIMTKKALC